MKPIRSSLSPTQMITCLETCQYVLENYRCSLSDYERATLASFVTSAVESMETNPEGRITILPYSVSLGVSMGLQDRKRLTAVKRAVSFPALGLSDKLCSELLRTRQPPTLRDTSQKNGSSSTKETEPPNL